MSAASQAPAFGQFGWAQSGLVFLSAGQGTGDDPHLAAFAPAAPSAREFHACAEQKILKPCAALDFEHLAQRPQLDLNERLQNLSPNPVKLSRAVHGERHLKNPGA